MGVATWTGFPSGGRAPSSSPEQPATLACALCSSCPVTASELLVPRLPLAQESSEDRDPSSEDRGGTLCKEPEGGKGPEMELRCRKRGWGSSLYTWLPLTQREDREAPSRWPWSSRRALGGAARSWLASSLCVLLWVSSLGDCVESLPGKEMCTASTLRKKSPASSPCSPPGKNPPSPLTHPLQWTASCCGLVSG